MEQPQKQICNLTKSKQPIKTIFTMKETKHTTKIQRYSPAVRIESPNDCLIRSLVSKRL